MLRLEDAVLAVADEARWVVLAGSLPPGARDDWYAELAERLRPSGARVAIDTSDGPLAALGRLMARAAPDLLKPNAEELAQLTGAEVRTSSEAVDAASKLVEQGAATVLATLGAAGAVLVNREGAWHAVPPVTDVVSTVGAGDSSLFGYLLGDLRGLDPEGRLGLAVAYGCAAARLPGTGVPAPHQVHDRAVDVCRIG